MGLSQQGMVIHIAEQGPILNLAAAFPQYTIKDDKHYGP